MVGLVWACQLPGSLWNGMAGASGCKASLAMAQRFLLPSHFFNPSRGVPPRTLRNNLDGFPERWLLVGSTWRAFAGWHYAACRVVRQARWLWQAIAPAAGK